MLGTKLIKVFPYFKCLAIISLALLGFIADTNGAARADAAEPDALIVSQSETPAAPREPTAPSPRGSQTETQTDEKKAPSDAKKKPLEDFQPSEQIEAEQAVDFPYDI